ncbi:hypothetical protein AVEN_148178-1 [Araneus ventricosus]|uniref:Uncharacterized protein n=1 Tax=Araneus ventricosus TaxID=182803 RepID=A0A4Y2H5K0_ARAVE|nr:hypothetical protein AVEN_242745-1 [Araneus ventricosus]GBM60802.1 hypothetical protein AVEN_274495-1 [Araneus ventricosus]GBM60809.1 hypothetical protein AVEN_40871-1 [Araneus ventricosus]GBM60870.1 hypothetical protein AVEN_148178-1 [Araneus ventricosus]
MNTAPTRLEYMHNQTQRDCFTVLSAQLYNAARDQFRSYGCRRQESPHSRWSGAEIWRGECQLGCRPRLLTKRHIETSIPMTTRVTS